jgi:predicted nucleotidyltransferase component of viral defense system
MITIEELNKIKEERKSNFYYEEKEYLQYIFLNSLFKKSQDFVFKGGTALRICFGLERASEDLDFSSELKITEIKKIFIESLKDFDLLNIPYEFYAEKKFKGNIRFEVRFKGPLFNGNPNSTNTLKVDFNSQVSFNKKAKVINKIFSDVPTFVLQVLDEKEILAEKIRSLINRGAPKDLYDLWFLFSKGVKINKKLIKKKLAEEKSEYKNLNFPSKEEYEISLKQLVNFLPEYNQVKKEVSEKIKEISK